MGGLDELNFSYKESKSNFFLGGGGGGEKWGGRVGG